LKAIAVENLEYSYGGGKKAVDGISFEVGEGEVFGFLGPNGAGKTTTQKVIVGLLKGYGGRVEVLGKDLRAWRSNLYERIGVSFELPAHYNKLTAIENLRLFSSFYRGRTADLRELLATVGLEEHADERVGSFSKGMKMKLNFARALLNRPDLVFLDEPTSGLDPASARQIKGIIHGLKKEGRSVFLTTHNMVDADELCDRVGFIVDGRISLVDAPRALKISHGRRYVRVEYADGGGFSTAEFKLEGLGDDPAFMKLLRSNRVQTIHTEEATLEDIFMRVTGRGLS
jgi:fluoroquinolone transport system ATP-binding protein